MIRWGEGSHEVPAPSPSLCTPKELIKLGCLPHNLGLSPLPLSPCVIFLFCSRLQFVESAAVSCLHPVSLREQSALFCSLFTGGQTDSVPPQTPRPPFLLQPRLLSRLFLQPKCPSPRRACLLPSRQRRQWSEKQEASTRLGEKNHL